MSRHSRLPTAGSGVLATDEGGANGEGLCCKVTVDTKAKKDVVPQHRRATSGSDIHLRKLRMAEKKSPNEDFLPEPPVGMGEAQRLTWQAQWGEALKKVQSLRLSGAQSERWSGVATDIYRPKSQETQANGRISNHASSLDRWNYYPGPSVNRNSLPQSQPNRTILKTRNKEFQSGATSNREAKLGSTAGSFTKGRVSKSITSFGKLEPYSRERIISEDFLESELGRSTILDQFNERPERHSALAPRVQRTQSQRHSRKWGQQLEAISDTAVPKPILKKAISMREGGAHQDAVLEMARAYTDTVCGVAKTLECGACGRNLGIIVQGNPGVDVAFCQACRPSPSQWKKPVSDSVAGSRRKKNVIAQFCRKMLRLDNFKKSM